MNLSPKRIFAIIMTNGTRDNVPRRPEHMLTADLPIMSRTQDRLGRCSFAKALAGAISSWAGSESLVVALYGPWGSGKTSVKNLVVEALREGAPRQNVILEFNPWAWAAQEALPSAFFTELAITIGRLEPSHDAKKTAARLKAYAASLRLRGYIYSNIPKVLGGIGVILAGLGIATSLNHNFWLRVCGLIFFSAILILGLIASFTAGIAEKLADVFSARNEAAAQTLQERKQDLASALRALPHPVLVIVDDIDRLTPPEIRILFQLIKANADFPNLTYLLLFEREYVEDSLTKELRSNGAEYLKKVVQSGFDLPSGEATRIQKVLCDGLENLLNQSGEQTQFDQQRWSALFPEGLAPFFGTLRDVNRFLAELAFHVGVFLPHGVLEVNPIDLIGLETLRHFEPEVYRRIFPLKEHLTTALHRIVSSNSDEAHKVIIDELLKTATLGRRTVVSTLLKDLFPPAEWVAEANKITHESYPEWERTLRVCHDRIFDRYFHLAIPSGQISQAQVDQILTLLNNADGLSREFISLQEQGLLGAMLNRLYAFKEAFHHENIEPFLTALFNIGDELSAGRTSAFSISPLDRATALVQWSLRLEPDPDQRAILFRQAANQSRGIYLPIHKIRLEENDQGRKEDPDRYVFRPQDLPHLREQAVKRIRTCAKADTLASQRHLGRILHMWGNWSTFAEPQNWVKTFIATDDGFARFLLAFLFSTTTWEADKPAVTEWRMRSADIEPLIGRQALEERLQKFNQTEQGEDTERAIQALREMLERRRKGISDDTPIPGLS